MPIGDPFLTGLLAPVKEETTAFDEPVTGRWRPQPPLVRGRAGVVATGSPSDEFASFVDAMNETTKPYPAAKCHSAEEVDKMYLASGKSMQLQPALWVGPYTESFLMPIEKST
jgi:hypothetical protein